MDEPIMFTVFDLVLLTEQLICMKDSGKEILAMMQVGEKMASHIRGQTKNQEPKAKSQKGTFY